LARLREARWAGVEVESVSRTAARLGGVPVAVAVLATAPDVTSAAVTTYGADAAHVVLSPTDRLGSAQVIVMPAPDSFGSATVTALTAMLPVLRTVKE
jgi:hypothetical protein